MAKPITAAVTFAGTNPPWNLSSLDQNDTGAIGAINDLATYENFYVDTGTVNAILVVLPTGLTATLVAGLSVTVKIANTNTTQAVTLQVGSLGATTVKNQDLSSPQVGQLSAGSIVKFVYDGAEFQIVSGAGSGTAFFNALEVSTTAGVNGLIATGTTLQWYGLAAGALVDISGDKSFFTGTLTGCTTSPTCTCVWWRSGGIVSLTLNVGGSVTGTSNATSFTMTGLPAELQPATQPANQPSNYFEDNGAATAGSIQINALSGTILFYKGTSGAGTSWTASGTKGLIGQMTITYPLY
jgi:hypothetical protein